MQVTVKRITIPGSKRQQWVVLEASDPLPDQFAIGINGGYCDLWSAMVDYHDGERIRSARARVEETWTEPTGEGVEQTRYARVTIDI